MSETMRAMAATVSGVELTEIPKPRPKPAEVRVKVNASAVNPGEEKVISGDFVGRFLHAKTDPLVLGWDFAGTVDALGDGVTDLAEGDAVWRSPAPSAKFVTFRSRAGRLPAVPWHAKEEEVRYLLKRTVLSSHELGHVTDFGAGAIFKFYPAGPWPFCDPTKTKIASDSRE